MSLIMGTFTFPDANSWIIFKKMCTDLHAMCGYLKLEIWKRFALDSY